MHRGRTAIALALLVGCGGTVGGGSGDASVGAGDGGAGDGGAADAAGAGDPDGGPPPVDPGIERSGDSARFDLAPIRCQVPLLESDGECPSGEQKCLCRPEFDALNIPKGSPGNPNGKVIIISQPRYGKRDDGSYAFDAYAAIKASGNYVGHYVNQLNPSRTCTAAESWTDVGCSGDAGCGWRCVTGAARADEIIDAEIAAYGSYPSPEVISLNEAWSLFYRNDRDGIAYRTWIRDLTKQMAARDRKALVFVQQITKAVGPFPLITEAATYGWLQVEAYLSGPEVLRAHGQCAPPYDDSNWCLQRYRQIRNAVSYSGRPAVPYGRLIVVEHFANNTLHYLDDAGVRQTAGWGRAFDDDPASPRFGTPSTSSWNTIVERRSQAIKALGSLAGAGSYSWGGNGSGTASSYRVQFARTYSAIQLP